MKFPWESYYDRVNGEMLEHRYGNRDALGNEWLAKRKFADKHEKKEDGKANPHHPRFVLEEKVARLEYDFAFLVEANRILMQQQEMLTGMFQRMAVLEGAYSHLMATMQLSRAEYTNLMKDRMKSVNNKITPEATKPTEDNHESTSRTES